MSWSRVAAVCSIPIAAVGAAVAWPAWSAAVADDAAARHARSLAASCTACHAEPAAPGDDSRLHSLAGLSEAQLLAALRAYRASDRRGDVMVQLAKGYTDAQLVQIAASLAGGPLQATP